VLGKAEIERISAVVLGRTSYSRAETMHQPWDFAQVLSVKYLQLVALCNWYGPDGHVTYLK
jgi:hypothetical protein